MADSAGRAGFWWVAGLALLFEIAHALLEGYWPGIRGSRLGPRPQSAVIFMFAEAVALMLVFIAAIRSISNTLKIPEHSWSGIFAVAVTVLLEGGFFFLLWQH
jgi:hypothetical protein